MYLKEIYVFNNIYIGKFVSWEVVRDLRGEVVDLRLVLFSFLILIGVIRVVFGRVFIYFFDFRSFRRNNVKGFIFIEVYIVFRLSREDLYFEEWWRRLEVISREISFEDVFYWRVGCVEEILIGNIIYKMVFLSVGFWGGIMRKFRYFL